MSKHGMVKVIDGHFEYEDGTFYSPFGTTIYALAHQNKELIEESLNSLANSPFNKVRMCVFPKHYLYNTNDPEFLPWEINEDGSWNVDAPVREFWDNLEAVIKRLGDMEIECDLVLFHSYDKWKLSSMSHENDLKYLDFIVERLGHLDNIWWSLANEYDLLLSVKTMEDWYDIEEHLAMIDKRHHLLSNHNCFNFWDVKRPNITHGSYQTKRFADVEGFVKEAKKPIVIDECCYEGDIEMFWGNISGEEMVARFWQCIASGAFCTHGETFLDEKDILWWAKGGKLKGKSTPRIDFLKKIVYEVGKPFVPYEEKVPVFALLDDEKKAAFFAGPAGPSFPLAMGNTPEFDMKMLAYTEHEYLIHTEDDSAILKYYYGQCSLYDNILLPEGKKYKVEVIDTWNMTREIFAQNVSGIIKVKLTGRPYMAVLATII